MGRLDTITDMTGDMDAVQVNAANIDNIINELNRNSDQLDAISNSLNIIGRGSISGTWQGQGGINNALTLSSNHGFGSAPIFLGSFTRSDQSGTFYPTPQWFFDNTRNFIARAVAFTDSQNISFSYFQVSNGPQIILTFSWYIIQQPAQVPTGL